MVIALSSISTRELNMRTKSEKIKVEVVSTLNVLMTTLDSLSDLCTNNLILTLRLG